MLNLIPCLLFAALAFFRTRGQLAIETLALRCQLGILKRSVKWPRLSSVDRGLWVLLSRCWAASNPLIIVKRATACSVARSCPPAADAAGVVRQATEMAAGTRRRDANQTTNLGSSTPSSRQRPRQTSWTTFVGTTRPPGGPDSPRLPGRAHPTRLQMARREPPGCSATVARTHASNSGSGELGCGFIIMVLSWLVVGFARASPAASHDILDMASRCFEPLAITGETGDSVKFSGRAAVARYTAAVTTATATDRRHRNV